MPDLLRIATAGSVDDGKSTLIGRLLLDSKQLLDDQGEDDLAHVTDGLRAEREQGITIDVAYRFFATRAALVHPRRHAGPRPLHAQHGHRRLDRRPRAGADRRPQGPARAVAPARLPGGAARHPAPRGVREQDGPRRRSTRSASARSRARSAELGAQLGIADVRAVPISALRGRQRRRRARRGWRGTTPPPLLEQLETVEVDRDRNLDDVRFPVQWTVRDGDYRGYAGRVAGGVLATGDEVVVLPVGLALADRARSTRRGGPVERAFAADGGDAAARGRARRRPRRPRRRRRADAPEVARELDATVCWMVEAPARVGARYLLKHTTRRVRANIAAIDARVDIDSFEASPGRRARAQRHRADHAAHRRAGAAPTRTRPTARPARSS